MAYRTHYTNVNMRERERERERGGGGVEREGAGEGESYLSNKEIGDHEFGDIGRVGPQVFHGVFFVHAQIALELG
jgi:hypothetical protein